jgi:hypothetical protein
MSYMKRADQFDSALTEAKTRLDADNVLAQMLADPKHDGREKPLIAAALGRLHGEAGSAALRNEFTRVLDELTTAPPSIRRDVADIACACIWALGSRDGGAATDVFARAARCAQRDIAGYGMQALAAVGDDSAWEEMLTWLGMKLERPAKTGTAATSVRLAAEYLARHSLARTDRQRRLAMLLRARWRNTDRESLEAKWPGIGPDGPPPERLDLRTPTRPAPWA